MLLHLYIAYVDVEFKCFKQCYVAYVSQAVNCILRWVRNKDTPVNGFIAGGLAGLTLGFYRSVTIALYAATKLVEVRAINTFYNLLRFYALLC